MYSWRCTAIVETRRSQGTETAKRFANHSMNSSSMKALTAYHSIDLAGLDMTEIRVTEEAVSRSCLRSLFSQTNLRDAILKPGLLIE